MEHCFCFVVFICVFFVVFVLFDLIMIDHVSGSAEHGVAVLNIWFCEETCGSRQSERTS